MAYRGYLIDINGYHIPLKFMRADTYKVSLNGQDLDSYRDADGYLHRQALEHTVPKIEFNTPFMDNEQVEELMSNIRSHYTNSTEKKLQVLCYIPELNDYWQGDVYMPDVNFQIYRITGEKIEYSETRIAFIGY